ncbi:MAG: gas vesicle protein [Chloroflexaceae bacterium]|nr:gas vesicle protein [Chloroflexaceae bacterium]NJO06474.1 gas vesicle protein [Chloroflexaceae bacterium]
MTETRIRHSAPSSSLADILERVLDKGVVVAGDITISLVGVELLNIRLRLLVASVDKAMEMGINWWESDPYLTTRAQQLEDENRLLRQRLDQLEATLRAHNLLESGTPNDG